jgi:hypothetical protein
MQASERATRGRFSPTTGLAHSPYVLRVLKWGYREYSEPV